MKTSNDDLLVFAHIGDLHLTDAKQRNFADFLAIAAQIEMECGEAIDFVVLPGDNADNGKPAQYRLMATGLRLLSRPVHVITGDHDMEQGRLDAFYQVLGADKLPKAVTVRGKRCLFLDVCGPGGGGPDFRLGADQMRWLTEQLRQCASKDETALLFMHTYPDDLKGEGETAALNRLVAANDVALVDMGHTHYNELANDGRTIFAATRSTGQIEEGPPGYSLASIDGDVVSWRFKPLDEGFPFVLITAPADHRLQRDAHRPDDDRTEVHALVTGQRGVADVTCRLGDADWIPMTKANGERLWRADMALPQQPLTPITVRARDESGRFGAHTIHVAAKHYASPRRHAAGSDADAIGAWMENGIMGTQLGPNRNGKPI